MVWLSQCHSIFFQHAAESMTGCGAVPRNVARSSWRTAICHDMAPKQRDHRLSDLACRQKWPPWTIYSMREGEKKMEETPYLEGGPVGAENDSMSLRRLPRPAKKILLFLDREGTNRERGDGERGHPLDPFIHCWTTRTACARVCQEQAREMDRWTMQKTEGGRERNK